MRPVGVLWNADVKTTLRVGDAQFLAGAQDTLYTQHEASGSLASSPIAGAVGSSVSA